MKRILIILVILTLSASAFSQYRDSSQPSLKSRFTQPQSGLFGLLNNPNLNMSHYYSMMYSSYSGGSVMQGMYLNSIRYQLSNPLTLNMNLGFMHQPYSSYQGGFTDQTNAAFIGGAELIYRPSKNFILSVGFNNIPYYYMNRAYPNHLYHSPFGAFADPWTSRIPETTMEIGK